MALIGVETVEGAGPAITTDEISARFWQVIKIALGAEGSATLLELGAQLAAASMPVAVATDQLSTLATQATLAAILTELGQKLEAADITGLATQTTLAAVLTELGQKLEPGDITGLATQATLATVSSTLTSILTELGQKLEAGDITGLATQATLASVLTELQAINTELESTGAPNAQAIQVAITSADTEVVPSRATRRGISIANIGANTCDLEPGAATFGGGFALAAGESVVLSYIGQIKARCFTALSTTLAVWEEWD